MKYKKIKDGVGDFESKEPSVLHNALIAELGPQGDPQRWYLNTSDLEIHLVILDKSLDTSGVDKVMKDHFKEDWTNYNPEAEAKTALQEKIEAATSIKDLKDILKEELK